MAWHELACSLLTCAVLLMSPVQSIRVPNRTCKPPTNNTVNIYNYTLPDILQTRNISLSEFRGKHVLIVNVATY
uniref:Glutathione peroxidase n=2 Tax=Parasteatoda tepidariorum TaxID=114398 RepID=A0A2L2Y3R7_PARTP